MSVVQVSIATGGNTKDFMCLDTDTKPTVDVGGGSYCRESNTKKLFIYDPVNINPATSNGWWEV